MRSRPVPHAYRVFFRHIGLDPDATRTPVEAAAMDRLLRGRYDAGGRVGLRLVCGHRHVAVDAEGAVQVERAGCDRDSEKPEQGSQGDDGIEGAKRLLSRGIRAWAAASIALAGAGLRCAKPAAITRAMG